MRTLPRLPAASMSRTPPPYRPPPDIGLVVCHLDDDLIVLDKPSGLLSVPGRGPGMDDNLASRVQARFPEALTVHRLDMDTSGLIVMARHPAAHRAMGKLFELRLHGSRAVGLVELGLVERVAILGGDFLKAVQTA